jgi:hypothetical protein
LAALPLFGQQSTADLERRVRELEERLQQLEKLLVDRGVTPPPVAAVQTPTPQTPAIVQEPVRAIQPVSITGDFQTSRNGETRLPVAGYMDFHVNKEMGDSYRPDFHRFVLLFGHSFSDNIKFWSEFELEHSLLEPAEGEGGEIALEQAYLDFLIKPYFNVRAGMVLTPMGIVNERHEPPSFNGVERPFVETFIIPSTWRELGAGITGDLGRGFRYRGYITSSLDASRFTAEGGISDGRAKGLDASLRNPAKSIRLEYLGVRRLTAGLSFYNGHTGYNLTNGLNPRVNMLEFDARYSYRRFDVRALFANTWLSKAGELNRQLQIETGVNPNVASQMRGFYIEPAYHVLPRQDRFDLIFFTRYEKYNTQQKMPIGYLPLGEFNRSTWLTGVTFKPTADVAVKFDYNFNSNESAIFHAVNGVNLGIGWWF